MAAPQRERRLADAPLRVEVRTEGEVQEPTRLIGYAAMFDREAVIAGFFREKIAPGAFAGALAGDVRALWNHDTNHVLGRTKAGTLRLSEDETGLRVEIDPPDTQLGRDLLISVQRGDISQMSFAFRAIREEWEEREGEMPLRTIVEAELFEVSPVTFPAYEDTEISARSTAEAALEERRQTAARAAHQRMRARLRIAAAE
ncbi:MAG TPA: HK97 family phage prohead protease [Vulgatibacter sp.]